MPALGDASTRKCQQTAHHTSGPQHTLPMQCTVSKAGPPTRGQVAALLVQVSKLRLVHSHRPVKALKLAAGVGQVKVVLLVKVLDASEAAASAAIHPTAAAGLLATLLLLLLLLLLLSPRLLPPRLLPLLLLLLPLAPLLHASIVPTSPLVLLLLLLILPARPLLPAGLLLLLLLLPLLLLLAPGLLRCHHCRRAPARAPLLRGLPPGLAPLLLVALIIQARHLIKAPGPATPAAAGTGPASSATAAAGAHVGGRVKVPL
jgi:hypothetical protein